MPLGLKREVYCGKGGPQEGCGCPYCRKHFEGIDVAAILRETLRKLDEQTAAR